MTRMEQLEAFKQRKLLEGPRSVPILPTTRTLTVLECVHLGEKIPGQPCGKPLFKCNKFNEITAKFIRCDKATRHCETCGAKELAPKLKSPEVVPLPPPTTKSEQPNDIGKRHLVYHILPVSGNGVWRKGIDQLRSRWNLFTGRKIFSVATGGISTERVDKTEGINMKGRKLPLDHPGIVKNYLPSDAELHVVNNDIHRWELAGWDVTWPNLFETAAENDVVWYGHAKGSTRKVESPCQVWADLLYRITLDHWSVTEKILKSYPLAGALRRLGKHFPPPNHESHWHYAGNFWWAKIDVLKQKMKEFSHTLINGHSAEAWFGSAYHPKDAGDIFSIPQQAGFLYMPKEVTHVSSAYSNWLATHIPESPYTFSPKLRGIALSVILPTIGRSTLTRSIESITHQLASGDQLIIKHDNSGDFGATPRIQAIQEASGDYLLFMDDDDVFTPNAFETIRREVSKNPYVPHIFSVELPLGGTIPTDHEIRVGNVTSQAFVIPNDKAKLGSWTKRYEGDYDFIASTLAHYPPNSVIFHPEVIAKMRPI